ncbi:MAG: VOC family protein [Pseudomonadales bacterium]
MKLAKDYIDIGLQTNNTEAMLRFWQEQVGLPYEELLKVGGGTHQHRHSLNGSVFKLNSIRDRLPDSGTTGYCELLIASPNLSSPRPLMDPDGNKVTLVPTGYEGVTHIGMRMEVSDLQRSRDFYQRILEADEVAPGVFRWATTRFFLTENTNYIPAADMRGKGYRYITVQVWDVDREHARIIELGGTEGRAPVTLGSTARISFIKDPDHNWIEVSQRASLTGELPDAAELP